MTSMISTMDACVKGNIPRSKSGLKEAIAAALGLQESLDLLIEAMQCSPECQKYIDELSFPEEEGKK
jgi:hypothetical protein